MERKPYWTYRIYEGNQGIWIAHYPLLTKLRFWWVNFKWKYLKKHGT